METTARKVKVVIRPDFPDIFVTGYDYVHGYTDDSLSRIGYYIKEFTVSSPVIKRWPSEDHELLAWHIEYWIENNRDYIDQGFDDTAADRFASELEEIAKSLGLTHLIDISIFEDEGYD